MSTVSASSADATSTTQDDAPQQLSSTNVFAFGFNSYSGFGNEGEPNPAPANPPSPPASVSSVVSASVDAPAAADAAPGPAAAAAPQTYTQPLIPVDPYLYASINSMGQVPQISAHAAYMSLPNNIVPNVNFMNAHLSPNANQANYMNQNGNMSNNNMNMNMHMNMNMGNFTGGNMGRNHGPSLCKFFAQGHCARGDQCNYAHISPTKGHSLQMMHMQPQQRGQGKFRGEGYNKQERRPRGHHNNNNNNNSNNNNNNTTNSSNPSQHSGASSNQQGAQPHQNHQPRHNKGHYKQHMMQGRQQQYMNHVPHNRQMHPINYGYDMNLMNEQHMNNQMGMSGDMQKAANYDSTLLNNLPGIDAFSQMSMSPMAMNHIHPPPFPLGPLLQDGLEQSYLPYPSPSDLLAKFTMNSTPEDLTGHIYLIAKDQYGCRLLQRMLEEQKPRVCDLTFTEVFEHMNELMTDPFGNYLCQKLIEHCTLDQRFAIIQKVAPDLVAISLNMHGTRAVQKLIETVNTPKEIELVTNALRTSVVTLIKDLNGNHVIQRCLHHLNAKDNQFIYDAISRHAVSVATHKHGCCVLQRTIDYASATQKRQVVQEVVANALELVQDAFGNYVVQYILELNEPNIANGVIQNLLGNISALSVQKFSSNVVEKCLELANDKMRVKLVDELINPERLPRLLQDPYANYVIQKALSVSKKQHFERLVGIIKPHLIALRNTNFGKRIQNKILKKFPDLNITFDFDDNGMMIGVKQPSLSSGGILSSLSPDLNDPLSSYLGTLSLNTIENANGDESAEVTQSEQDADSQQQQTFASLLSSNPLQPSTQSS